MNLASDCLILPMPYQAKPLHYKRFFRSATAPSFESFDKNDTILAWIDILGVQRMNHQTIKSVVKDALEVAAECSSVGPIVSLGGPPNCDVLIGTPQSVAQYTLVGDALLLVEKDSPETQAAATLGFIDRVCLASRILNELGYPHKGIITRGSVYCDRIDDTSLITGSGVVKAYHLESNLNAAGLFYDESLEPFLSQRSNQIRRNNWYEPFAGLNWNFGANAPNLSGVIFSQFSGWELWKSAIANGNHQFPKISNSAALIQDLQSMRNLP